MRRIILFPCALLIIFNLGCTTKVNVLNKYGIENTASGNTVIAIVNNHDCVNCLMAVRKVFNFTNDHFTSLKYIVIPDMRDNVFEQFKVDNNLKNEFTKIIRSDELINVVGESANITQFTSFVCKFNLATGKATDIKILKEFSDDHEIEEYFKK